MARKDTGQVPRSKGPGQRNNKTRSTKVSIPPYRPSRKKAYNPARITPRSVIPGRFRSPLGPVDPFKLSRDTRTRVINALGEWRENPNFTFSQIARRWHLDTRSFYRHAKHALRIDGSGRVHAWSNDRIQLAQQIPTTEPGEYRIIITRSYKERKLLGEWWAAINDAKAGRFARLHAFPKNTFIDGTRLPTRTS